MMRWTASTIRTLAIFFTLVSGSAFTGDQAAASVLVKSVFEGNDCSFPSGGVFSTGAPSICNVSNFQPDIVNGGLQRFSPLVFQLNSDGFKLRNSTLFPAIDGLEFAVGPFSDTGFFTYTPGIGDPDIRFWATEGTTQFLLSWFVADADAPLCANPLNGSCMAAAIAIPTGTSIQWRTAAEGQVAPNLSHITFYDSAAGSGVPTPATLPLFVTGLGLMGWFGWRRRRQQLA